MKQRILSIAAVIALTAPLALAATPAVITVTAPNSQISIQPQAAIITAESVTVNAQVNVLDTTTATVVVPGSQGPAGSDATAGPIKTDSPADGSSYARSNGSWVIIPNPTSGQQFRDPVGKLRQVVSDADGLIGTLLIDEPVISLLDDNSVSTYDDGSTVEIL